MLAGSMAASGRQTCDDFKRHGQSYLFVQGWTKQLRKSHSRFNFMPWKPRLEGSDTEEEDGDGTQEKSFSGLPTRLGEKER